MTTTRNRLSPSTASIPVNGLRENVPRASDMGSMPAPVSTAGIHAAGESDPENGALLAGIAEGDVGAFAKVYDRFAGPMFSLLVRILGARAEAEEVLKMGFEQVWRRASNYRVEQGSPFVWIMTIMRCQAIDALRARGRHLVRIKESFLGRTDAPEAHDAGHHPVRDEQRAPVGQALSLLSAREQQAIELGFFDGLTIFEIAAALDVPAETIKARIRRGMLKLCSPLAPATTAVVSVAS